MENRISYYLVFGGGEVNICGGFFLRGNPSRFIDYTYYISVLGNIYLVCYYLKVKLIITFSP